MIQAIKAAEISGLNHLPPAEWKLDYEAFLKVFLTTDFFYAFVLIEKGKVVGTGNVFLKGKIGWLANIIVAEQYRGKGFGFKITTFLVDFLKSKGAETQLLIATKLGEPVYRKIGFKKITAYQSFDTEIGYVFNPSNSMRRLEDADLVDLYELDRYANDENRAHLIGKYYRTGVGYFNPEHELLGVYLPDFGRGLVLSKDKKAGIELLKLKHSEKGRRTLIPIENQEGINFLEQSGLKQGVKSSKMVFGKENKWNPACIYSYASGYCG